MSFCPHCGREIAQESKKEAFKNFPEENISIDALFEEAGTVVNELNPQENTVVKPYDATKASSAQKAYDKANATKLAEEISKW